MTWIGILLVSPLWGALSTWLFLCAWLAFAELVIALLGFVRGAVPRKETALAMGVYLSGMVVCSLLLEVGLWLFTSELPFGRTKAENVVYWISAGAEALILIPAIPSKMRKAWRNAMISGSLDEDIFKRKLGAAERPLQTGN